MLADGGGLYLQVTPSGAKTWIFRFQLHGRRRNMGLGSIDVRVGSKVEQAYRRGDMLEKRRPIVAAWGA